MAAGLTLTPTALVAGRLPGVMTPVPFAKTPVRVALDPDVMEVGFAAKLVIEAGGGGGGGWVLDDPPPQPVKPKQRVKARGARTRRRFNAIPRFSQVRFSQESGLCKEVLSRLCPERNCQLLADTYRITRTRAELAP